MSVDYKKDTEENEEFDKTLNPKGTFQKPSVEQLREGVKIRNKSRYRSGEGSQDFLNKTSKFFQDNKPTVADISEGLVDAKATHIGSMLGGSILGEYLPLPEGTGAVVGGAVGYAASKVKQGIVDFAFNQSKRVWEDGVGWVYKSLDGTVVGNTLEELYQNTQARIRGIQSFTEGGPGAVIGESGTGGARAMSGGDLPSWNRMSRFNPEHVKKVNYTLRQWGMPDGTFDYSKFLSKVRKVDGVAEKTATEGREFVELFENISEFAEDFKGVRGARHAEFKARWVDFLEARGIDSSAVQLHHINALYDSLPLYDGLKFDSEEWWDLTAELLRNNVRPGTFASSNKKSNLMSVLGFSNQTGTGATDAMPHGVAHLFYKDKLGNPKYYGTNDARAGFYSLDEINKMKTIPGYRLEKAQTYSEIVNRSEDIVEQAMKTWEVMSSKGNMNLEETIEFLGKLDDNGLLDVTKIEGRYQVPQLQQMIETITQEMDSLPREVFKNDEAFERWLLNLLVDKNISNKIFNPIKRKIKKRYVKQPPLNPL